MRLAIDNEGIDAASDIVDRGIAHEVESAAFWINLDFANRASIREHQMSGVSTEKIHDWIDRREAVGEISEEEGAIGRLIARHYTRVVWDAIYPVSIGA